MPVTDSLQFLQQIKHENYFYFNGSFNKVLQNEFPAQRRNRELK